MRLSLTKNSVWIQIFTVFFCISTLLACSESDRPKNVRRGSQRGQNRFEKPTSESGVNAAGYMGFLTLGTKQLQRTLDIVLKRGRSEFIHSCQLVKLEPQENNTESISVQTSDGSCHGERNVWTWNAVETFVVKYEDAERGSQSKILSITRNTTRDIRITQNTSRMNYAIDVYEEVVIFEKTNTANIYKFTYASQPLITKTAVAGTPTPDTKQKKKSMVNWQDQAGNASATTVLDKDSTAERREETIEDDDTDTRNPSAARSRKVGLTIRIEGTVNITNRQDTKWSFEQGAMAKYDRYSANGQNIEFSSTLSLDQAATDLSFVCGRPMGQFLTLQEATGAPEKYHPRISVAADGTITTTSLITKFQTRSCSTGQGYIEGFADVTETVLAAEAIAVRPVDFRRTTSNDEDNRRRGRRGGANKNSNDDLEINADLNLDPSSTTSRNTP